MGEYIDKNDPGATVIPSSGTFEQKLMDFETDDERKAYCEETKCTSILDKIVVQGYKALQLQYFFTAGEDEVKAWTIQRGSTAPQAAGRIHTDFEKGFIMAEVMKFAAFKEHGSEAAVKAAGVIGSKGRTTLWKTGTSSSLSSMLVLVSRRERKRRRSKTEATKLCLLH